MVDTRRDLTSFTDATTGLFRAGRAGGITSQDMRDFVVSVYGGTALFIKTVKSGGDITPSDLNPGTGTNFTGVAGEHYYVDVSYCETLDTNAGNVRFDLFFK